MVGSLLKPMLIKIGRVSGIALLSGLTTIAILHQPSYANRPTFVCETNKKGTPVTYASTSYGKKIPIIRWVDQESFPKFSPLERCREVSRRFQTNYDQGNLKRIITGKVGKYPVVCAAISTNDDCTEKTVLFTLSPGTNAKRVVEKLLDARGLAAGEIHNQNGNDSQIYVDFNTYLNHVKPEP